MFAQILSKISILFFLLLIGALARYKKLLTAQATNDISIVVVVVTLPFLYFYTLATQCSKELLAKTWILPLAAIGLVFFSYLLGWLISSFFRLDKPCRNTFVYLIAFTNCGFLAIPVAFALFGQRGVIRVIMFNIGYSLLLWTLGVWTLSHFTKKKINPLRSLLNTGTVALLLGLLVGSFSFKLPSFFLEASDILGKATIPLALLVVGAILAGGNLRRNIPYKVILSLVVCRLIVMPTLALAVTGLFSNLPHLIRAIIVLQAAMPSASTTPLFIRRFGGGDDELAASGVFFTTLFSIITVPVFLSLI
jgi:predicted permease